LGGALMLYIPEHTFTKCVCESIASREGGKIKRMKEEEEVEEI